MVFLLVTQLRHSGTVDGGSTEFIGAGEITEMMKAPYFFSCQTLHVLTQLITPITFTQPAGIANPAKKQSNVKNIQVLLIAK